MKKKESPKHLSRARFGEIVCEYLAPARASRKVIIICSGMPGYPGGRGKAVAALAAKGYWIFIPRYRGSWESGGKFLEKSPHEDVLAVIAGIERGFKDLWSGARVKIKAPEFYLVGGSFGGPAALLAARDTRVRKVVAISAVADWRAQEGTTEPVKKMERFVREAFGEGYRSSANAWQKLASGKFYNPAAAARSIPGKKILFFHTKDDDVVPFAPAKKLAEEIGARFVGFARGGHGGAFLAARAAYWRRIKAFFRER